MERVKIDLYADLSIIRKQNTSNIIVEIDSGNLTNFIIGSIIHCGGQGDYLTARIREKTFLNGREALILEVIS